MPLSKDPNASDAGVFPGEEEDSSAINDQSMMIRTSCRRNPTPHPLISDNSLSSGFAVYLSILKVPAAIC